MEQQQLFSAANRDRTDRTRQLNLFADAAPVEDPQYLTRQLITYIGNKRNLLGHIGKAVERVKQRLGKQKLRALDLFSGSGVVSRFLKAHTSYLASNDIEDYAAAVARCYLQNRSSVDMPAVNHWVAELNSRIEREPLPQGFIESLYAPRDEQNITKDDRVFYTKDNARRLDNYRRLLDSAPRGIREMLLGPLLGKASVHANTAGVFKGFYKNRQTQVGQFGGSGSDALVRIKGTIFLEPPILSLFECETEVFQADANLLAAQIKDLDLAYIDPPYNQHPYGSNYFMLNLLVSYVPPTEVSRVSGIPTNWRRSGYNVRSKSLPLLQEVLDKLDAPFLLISFNNEGFISPNDMHSTLRKIGTVEVLEIPYTAFRGSRNFDKRSIHVTEQLFLVERR